MNILHPKKLLSTAVSMAMTVAVCQSVATQASDIEIYKSGTGGTTSILLMLDTSGSMGISSLVLPKNNAYGSPGDVDNTVCESTVVSEAGGNMAGNIYEYQYNAKDLRDTVKVNGTTVTNPTQRKTSFYKEVIINGTTVPYYVRGCGTATVDSNGKLVESGNNRFDRLSRLKDAVLTLLADTALSNNIQIGLGHFSSKTDLFVGKTDSTRKIPLVDGHSGTILLPANALTPTHRLALAQKIAAFKSLDTTTNEQGVEVSNQKYSSLLPPLLDYKASSGTPTAHAYAEAAAYMMGTQTRKQTYTGDVKFIYDGTSFVVNENAQSGQPKQAYYICAEVATSGSTNGLGYTGNVKWCQNAWPGINSTSGGKLIPSVQSNIKIPYGDSEWLNLTGNYSGDKKTAVDVAKTKLNAINFANDWDVYTKLPSGWRYGGWMKVDQQPMDIEPIAGLAWESFKVGNTQYFRNLVSYRASPFTLDGTNDNVAGGFSYSAATTKDPGNSTKYKAGGSTSSCDGNGIYFLTDGAPNSTKDSMARWIMNDTLTTALVTGSPAGTYGFSQKPTGTVLESPSLKSNLFSVETGGWEYIGEYSKKILNPTRNPAGMKIKTAVVGFGSSFAGIPQNTDGTYNCEAVKDSNKDAYNACLWGSKDYGDGGFYYAEDSDGIRDSIIDFVEKTKVVIDPVVTGSPTIPQDALNPLRVQPYGYYTSFDPKPSQSLWVGNMNKYHVVNGNLKGSDKISSIFKNDGSFDSTVAGLWSSNLINGFKGTLELGANSEQTQFVRNVLTNRVINGGVASEGNSLAQVTKESAYLSTDPKQRYWLNLLGYDVDTSVTAVDPNLAATYLTATANLRQVGATMHSTPILLTQSGTIASDLTTTNRKDYLLFGTTQGLLHVVDSESGKEVFAFAPHEMMERQPKALLEESKSGPGNLFYGIDAPWAAYTEYVNNKNGSLTVGQSDYSSTERNKLTGKQWVYGGLRMGGRSYYALDLSSISSPVLKFHIDPANQTIHYGAYKDADNNDVAAGEHSNVGALSYMGDSWSKPTLAYVNFGGKKKLVMFVGGGYDEGYEAPDYNPTTATKGNGVYMFDANNGKLLWWTGANATTKDGAEAYTTSTDMKYSVVSQINAIDRDNDGLVDNLYFGDLGGQAFRVDLNNAATGTGDNAAVKLESQKTNFATRVVLLTSRHAGGASPRFYEMPSFSVHRDSSLGLYGVVALSSGNRSSPLAGVVSTNNPSASTSANDGVFVVFDKDVGRTDLYTLTDSGASALKTKNVTLANLKSTYSTTGVAPTQAGWYYSYGTEDTEAGVYKGMNSIYAVDSILYANVFHRDGKGIGGGCGAGVKGDSYLYRFCLPSGSCSGRFNGADGKPIAEASPQSVALGAGILGSALGGASELKNIAPSTTDCNIAENKNKIECQAFTTAGKIRTLRWYETR